MKTTMIILLATVAAIAQQTYTRVPLQSVTDRKAAPGFVLSDAAGKKVTLRDLRGKVVLLDFWATWCTGCKQEIPWFSEFAKTYGGKDFAAVGVSLDDGGWKVLKPFLAEHPIPYRIVLGDNVMAGRYGIKGMPDTFLIDRKGKIAAAYTEGLVDRDNVEANIKALLSRR
jgi:peroxiredoxin